MINDIEKLPTASSAVCSSSSSSSSGSSSSSSSMNNNINNNSINNNSIEEIHDKSKGLHVKVFRQYQNQIQSEYWWNTILDNTDWYRVKYKSGRFQKDCETPCWTTFFGGRKEYKPYHIIPNWLQPLVDKVSSDLKVPKPFNAILVRLYFDGNDEIAWHTDGRTFLGNTPTIASLSFGSKANFQMRRMTNVWPSVNGNDVNNNQASNNSSNNNGIDYNTPQHNFIIGDGDMLVMLDETQKYWHHRVPKEKGGFRNKPRININFRYINPGKDAERGQKTYYKYMVHGDDRLDDEKRNLKSYSFKSILAMRGGIMNFMSSSSLRPNNNKRILTKCNEDASTSASASASAATDADGNNDNDCANKKRKVEYKRTNDINNNNGKPSSSNNRNDVSTAAAAKQIRQKSNDENDAINDCGADAAATIAATPNKTTSTSTSTTTQQDYYLSAPENNNIDKSTFMALPDDIRKELINEWWKKKCVSQRRGCANTTNTNTNIKLEVSQQPKVQQQQQGHTYNKQQKQKSIDIIRRSSSAAASRTGTLHSFFSTTKKK
ncbi:MAG: alkylated DNA repair dioxygenase AlkB [Bacillariaceae sp.]|jgi:alkylated DNA repair dioxygenase AlkB